MRRRCDSAQVRRREQRAFSSGCIRTERPLELAELLLANPERWKRAAIDAVVDSGKTRTLRAYGSP
jgi:L,D-transpeptidase YcbB